MGKFKRSKAKKLFFRLFNSWNSNMIENSSMNFPKCTLIFLNIGTKMTMQTKVLIQTIFCNVIIININIWFIPFEYNWVNILLIPVSEFLILNGMYYYQIDELGVPEMDFETLQFLLDEVMNLPGSLCTNRPLIRYCKALKFSTSIQIETNF
jgi:hypothetical protein